jgi:hypothetical protein
MILRYAIPKLEAKIKLANETNESQEERFLLNELSTHDKISSALDWLSEKGVNFETSEIKDRFIIKIHPSHDNEKKQ